MTSLLKIKKWLIENSSVDFGEIANNIAELANVEPYDEVRHGSVGNYLFDCHQVVLDKLSKIFSKHAVTRPNPADYSDVYCYFNALQEVFNDYYLLQDEKCKLELLRSPRTKLGVRPLLEKRLESGIGTVGTIDLNEFLSAIDNAQRSAHSSDNQSVKDKLKMVGNDKHRVDELVLAAKAIARLTLDNNQAQSAATCGWEAMRAPRFTT